MSYPKGPKYLYGTKYGFCSSNFPCGLAKYSPYGYLGPFGLAKQTQAEWPAQQVLLSSTTYTRRAAHHAKDGHRDHEPNSWLNEKPESTALRTPNRTAGLNGKVEGAGVRMAKPKQDQPDWG